MGTKKSDKFKIYFIVGTDDFRRNTRCQEITASLLTQEEREFQLERYDETSSTLEACMEAIQTPSLFNDKKVILVSGISKLLEKSTKQDEWWNLIKDHFPDNVTLLLTDAAVDKRKQLFRNLKEIAHFEEYEILDDGKKQHRAELELFCIERARSLSREIDRAAIDFLVESLGGETGLMDSELEKIDIFLGKNQQKITKEICREILSGTREALIYELNDAIMSQSLEQALMIFKHLTGQKESPQAVIASLVKIYRLWIQAASLLSESRTLAFPKYYDPDAIKTWAEQFIEKYPDLELLKEHPYRVYLFMQYVAKQKVLQLIDGYQKIVDTLKHLQSSALPIEHWMELLLYQLCKKI